MSFGINAKANVYTAQWNVNTFEQFNSGQSGRVYQDTTGSVFSNKGHGNIVFNLTYWGQPSWYPIDQVSVVSDSNNTNYVCDTGNSSTYYDNGTMMTILTVNCRIYTDSKGISYVYVHRPSVAVGTMYVSVAPLVSFTTIDSEASAIINGIGADLQQQITSGQQNTQALQNTIDNATAREVQAIQGQQQQQHQDMEDIKNYDTKQGDGEDSKPDTSVIGNEQQAQDQVLNDATSRLDNIQRPQWDLTQFTPAFTWIWMVIGNCLNTNSLIFITLIIMLSIGLVKLVLGR